MIARARSTLRNFLELVYSLFSPNLKPTTKMQYRIAVGVLEEFRAHQIAQAIAEGMPPPEDQILVDELSDELLCEFMAWMIAKGYERPTVKHKRGSIMAIWRMAKRKGYCSEGPDDVPTIKLPKRKPRAWTVAQVGKILEAVNLYVPRKPLPGWTAMHWRALVLVIYDTSYRIGVLLKTPPERFDPTNERLSVDADDQKDDEELSRWLHPDTVAALQQIVDPLSDRLFAWPYGKRRIWPHFRKILQIANLPATKKDLFQKLRRTSYTQVVRVAGKQAASDHAGHSSDLSAHYEDVDQTKTFEAAKLIERPPLPTRQLPLFDKIT